MEDVESCKNLLDQGEYDFDTQKYKHHPFLSIISGLVQAFRKAGNVMLATSKTNEIIDEKFLQKQHTNNDIKKMFKRAGASE